MGFGISLRCPFHVFIAGILFAGATVYAYSVSKRLIKRGNWLSLQRFEVEARYSEATKYQNLVFISGQVSSGEGNIKQQTAEALENVERALALAGSNKSRILDVTIWLSDIDRDYSNMNVIYESWLAKDSTEAPCRACIQAKLFAPNHLIEIKVIAATGDQ